MVNFEVCCSSSLLNMKPWNLLFLGMGNLMDSMKKAQEIAKQAEVINKELMGTVVVGNGKFMIYMDAELLLAHQ
jgi:hypothetical protein